MPYATTHEEFLTTMQEKDNYPPPPEIVSAFRKLLTEPSIPVSAIAKDAASPIVATLPNIKDPLWPDCGMLWRTLCRAVDTFGDLTDRFVDFVVELQKLSDGNYVFKNLPQFRNHWTEFGLTTTYFVSTDPERNLRHRAQLNQHAFCAKLSTHDYGSELDQIGRAGFVFRSTCEFAPWERVHFPEIEEYYDPPEDGDEENDEWWQNHRDIELERSNIRILNVKIPLAAQWLRTVGPRLYKMEGPLEGEWDWQVDVLNVKWKGEKGWSKERWAFWKERFEWMTKVTALEKWTQRLAGECRDMMGKIEREEM